MDKQKPEPMENKVSFFLDSFKCCSPCFPNNFGRVIKVPDTATIGDALQVMTKHRILSLPVVHSVTGMPLWVLGMFDLVAYCISNFEAGDFQNDFYHKFVHLVSDKFKELSHRSISAIEASADYTLDPVFVVDQHDSIAEAVKIMMTKKTHRVLVCSSTGELVNLITQSRVMQFLPGIIEGSPSSQKTVKELGLGEKNVISVNAKETAYCAFNEMVKNRVSGLAVVNDSGLLVGNISISDFKLCGYQSRFWDLLGLSVRDYMKEIIAKPEVNIRTQLLYSLGLKEEIPLVKCHQDDSLLVVVKLFSFYGVHRLFVVDDQRKPIAVISLTDLLREVVSTPLGQGLSSKLIDK